MKMTLSTNQVADALKSDQYAAWSYYGASALATYFQELEECIWPEEELELDLVAIRSDYSEYESAKLWAVDYFRDDIFVSMGIDLDGEETEDEREKLIRGYIRDHGQLIEFTGGIIVSNF
jgi:hypothetical protein